MGLPRCSRTMMPSKKWLVDEVVPTLDEMAAHPERLLSPEEVKRRLDDHAASLGRKLKAG